MFEGFIVRSPCLKSQNISIRIGAGSSSVSAFTFYRCFQIFLKLPLINSRIHGGFYEYYSRSPGLCLCTFWQIMPGHVHLCSECPPHVDYFLYSETSHFRFF
ncbi:hypothetical protein XENOCAPTIV_006946 [Xenoophorus captivus]|uniref:Uncharacterized protein n=1 Tax=Xenoophorus captivus TaxID=1517983 RepID=A0ABV0RXI9_9TELE